MYLWCNKVIWLWHRIFAVQEYIWRSRRCWVVRHQTRWQIKTITHRCIVPFYCNLWMLLARETQLYVIELCTLEQQHLGDHLIENSFLDIIIVLVGCRCGCWWWWIFYKANLRQTCSPYKFPSHSRDENIVTVIDKLWRRRGDVRRHSMTQTYSIH